MFALGFEGMGSLGPQSFVKVGSFWELKSVITLSLNIKSIRIYTVPGLDVLKNLVIS